MTVFLTSLLCQWDKNVFLLQTTELANKALQVSPYSGAAYGALVFVLGAIAYLTWKQKNELESRHYDFLSKVLGVMQMVESKMEMITPIKDDVQDLQRRMENIEGRIDDIDDAITEIDKSLG